MHEEIKLYNAKRDDLIQKPYEDDLKNDSFVGRTSHRYLRIFHDSMLLVFFIYITSLFLIMS